jgi:tetratricopeptide (TPR) repeat protein
MQTLEYGLRLKREGRIGEALPIFLAAARSDPSDATAWYQAGRCALLLRQPHLAVRLFEACLRIAPDHVKAIGGLCVSSFQLGAFQEAHEACQRALVLDPAHLPSRVMCSRLSYMLARPEEGRRAYEIALAQVEAAGDLDTGVPQLRLAHGDRGAWRCYTPGGTSEQLTGLGPWSPPKDRVWKGEVDRSATVCIYRDGGNGDVFLFARYIPLVAERVGRVFLTASVKHDRLLEPLPGLSGIVRHPREVPEALHAHLWSLPGLFGDAAQAAAASIPYLQAPAAGPALDSLSQLRVGLAWAGHPNTPINADRSVPIPELLGPLLAVPGVDWVSLQVGYREEEVAGLPFAMCPSLQDFGDTARVIEQLDLVITVDTAVANLAGALGKKAWVMVPTYPEFRWGIEGEWTPWYPSLRLFRREHTREWEGVIGRVASALSRLLRSDSGSEHESLRRPPLSPHPV